MSCRHCKNLYCNGGCVYNTPMYNPPYTQPCVNSCDTWPPHTLRNQCGCGKCQKCKTGCIINLSSDCVHMCKAYPCLGIAQNDLLTVAFDRVEELCNSQTGATGVVKYGFGGGDFPIDNIIYPDGWTVGPADYAAAGEYTASKTGCYKITVQYSVDFDPNSSVYVGVGINGAIPDITNPFVYGKLQNPDLNSNAFGTFVQTKVWYVCVNKNDVIRLLYLAGSGLAEFSAGIQMMFERVPLIS